MKKFLLTAVLILAVLTSLTAGTLASYNKTLSIDGIVRAKAFDFAYSNGTNASFSAGLAMAPGETQEFMLNLVQTSEVDMHYVIVPSVPQTEALGRLLSVVVTTDQGVPLDKEAGNYVYNKAAGATTILLKVKVTWAGTNNVDDTDAAGKSTTLNVNVNGTKKV